jgi:hypothetical protein
MWQRRCCGASTTSSSLPASLGEPAALMVSSQRSQMPAFCGILHGSHCACSPQLILKLRHHNFDR